jgi:hypothetical protein
MANVFNNQTPIDIVDASVMGDAADSSLIVPPLSVSKVGVDMVPPGTGWCWSVDAHSV